jgi:hypothetical protein
MRRIIISVGVRMGDSDAVAEAEGSNKADNSGTTVENAPPSVAPPAFAPPQFAPPPPGYYPPIPPPPPGFVPQFPVKPRNRTGLYVTLAVVGFLGIVAATASVVVAVGTSSGSSRSQQAAASAPSVGTAPSAVPTTAAPTVTPSVAPAPTPSSTLKGYVHGSTHSGDLRFFLLPVPSDAEAEGDPNGVTESVSDIAKELNDPSTSKGILKDYGCSGGATRTYQTNDGTLTVAIEIIHFDSDAHADDWVSGLSFTKGTSFSVAGVSNAQGYAFDPTDADSPGSLVGISHVGDVEYEIDVDGTGKLAHSLLTPLMQREEKLLSSGH